MSHRGALFLMVIAVPAIAFAVASGLIWKNEGDWKAALVREFPTASAEQLAAFTLDRVCENPAFRKDLESACFYLGLQRLIRWASIATSTAGLGWLGLIAVGGRAARRNRKLLLHVFRPGLDITVLFLICLIAAHAALAIVTIYLGEAALIRRVHIGILAGIGIGALAGVGAVAKASSSVVRTVTTTVIGKSTSAQDSPLLWSLVQRLSQSIGVQAPEHIVVGLNPNFFVTEAPVRTIDGELSGRTMFMSLPLSRILTQDELRAVIGHELGHYKGLDTEFSRKFYPIYRGTHDALQGLAEGGGEGARWIALIPAVAILSFFLDAFAVAENTISRERELAADKVGAAVSGPDVTAAALVKIHAFAGYWEPIQTEMVNILEQGKVFTNISAIYSQFVSENARPEALNGLDQRRLSHPTDSHPPLSLRLENLGVTLPQVQAATLQTRPEKAAILLVANYEGIEQHLTEIEHYVLARSLGIGTGFGVSEETQTAG